MLNKIVLVSITAFLVDPLLASEHWSQFRGPTGDGVIESNHPQEWSEEKNIAWKVPIEGIAWSQPIVWENQVFVTTAVAADQKAPRPGDVSPGFSFFSGKGLSRVLTGGTPANIQCEWKLLCLELESGKRIWEKTIHSGKPPIAIHQSNSYASDTPATDGERVYVQVAMVGLWCFDLQGNQIWMQELPKLPMQYGWGAGSSVLLHEDSLYLVCDNEKRSYLSAFDKVTGKLRWQKKRDESSNWSTPYLWKNSERVELVLCGGKRTRAYNPDSGEELWSFPADGRTATTAVGNRDVVIVGSVSKSQGASSRLSAIKVGASGKISPDDKAIAWSLKKSAPELASPLICGGRLFTFSQQGGIVRCFDLESGKLRYRKRLPKAGLFTASPWTDGKSVWALSENGTSFTLNPDGDFQVIHSNALDGMFWSSAAIAQKALLLRSAEHLYCIRK